MEAAAGLWRVEHWHSGRTGALYAFLLAPTSFWLGQQVVNAFPGDTAPRIMIRDRDKAHGNEFTRCVQDLGIRSIKTAVRAPRMNCYAERLIGTIRRELFDHVIVSRGHARRLLREFQVWYNEDRCPSPKSRAGVGTKRYWPQPHRVLSAS